MKKVDELKTALAHLSEVAVDLSVSKGVADARGEARSAISRIEKGIKYGDDMKSSAVVCYEDAIELLKKAIVQLK